MVQLKTLVKLLFNLICFLGLIGDFFGNENVSAFLKNLPREQRLTLDWFFRNSMKSMGGYVLCGDKPMGIESYRNGRIDLNLSECWFAKVHAFQILKNWSTYNEEMEYLFLFYDDYQSSQMIIINRKKFIKTVNDNISLFRYILGRTITAENLLSELIKNQNKFFEILKDDALVGILLGYGTENSLVYSRAVDICKNCSIGTSSGFPFYNYTQDKPSLGFLSLEEEKNVLESMTVASDSIIDFDTYQMPYFGCIPSTEETDALISMYKKNHATIVATVEETDFLEKILEKIFTTTSGKIKLPSNPSVSNSLDLTNRQELAAKFSEVIYDKTLVSGLNQKALLKSVLQGLTDKCYENLARFSKSQHMLHQCELSILPAQIECCKNLILANNCFEHFSTQKGWISLIPNGIAYKVLKKGRGLAASSKIHAVTFHLSYRLGSEKKFTHSETIKTDKIEHLIPGIARVLINMRKGEQRKVCIHPRYAYGFSAAPPNATFIAEVQLIDFEEGNTEITFLPESDLEPTYTYMGSNNSEVKPLLPCGLDTCTNEDLLIKYKALLTRRQKLKEEEFYHFGIQFWDIVQSNGGFIDFKELCKCLRSRDKKKHFQSDQEKDQFIRNFKLHLFAKHYENGEGPSFPEGWL